MFYVNDDIGIKMAEEIVDRGDAFEGSDDDEELEEDLEEQEEEQEEEDIEEEDLEEQEEDEDEVDEEEEEDTASKKSLSFLVVGFRLGLDLKYVDKLFVGEAGLLFLRFPLFMGEAKEASGDGVEVSDHLCRVQPLL